MSGGRWWEKNFCLTYYYAKSRQLGKLKFYQNGTQREVWQENEEKFALEMSIG